MKENKAGSYTLKELAAEDRPREKLLLQGTEGLSNAEILAVLINSGTSRRTAVELCQDILQAAGSLRELAGFSAQELSSFSGIGPAKSARIIAAFELSRRLDSLTPGSKTLISSPAEAARLIIPRLRFLQQEVFLLIMLNSKNRVLQVEEISRGGLASTVVQPREIFKAAIKKSAAAVILCHNHPSGETDPSRDDIMVTEKIISAGKLVGISVLDHLIIGYNCFTSLKEEGYI